MFINRKNIAKHLRDLAIMIIISLLMSYIVSKIINTDETFSFKLTFLYGFINGFFLWKGNEYIPYKLDQFMPWRKYLVKRLIVNTLASFVFTILFTLFFGYIWFRYILNHDLESMISLIIDQVIMVSICIFLGLLTVYTFQFFNYWKEAIKNEEKLKREVLSLQYESLKNQVNPHFLFNCLNILTPLVYKDQDEAAKFIKQFSEVYRYVLEQKDNELVNIETEMEFVNSFIYLNKIRFGNALNVEIDINSRNNSVVPLSIQMLVENAIKHNIITKDKPLKIKIYEKDSSLIIENNLQKKDNSKNSNKTGLKNIKSRYEYISDKEFIIEESEGSFKVKIPLINKI